MHANLKKTKGKIDKLMNKNNATTPASPVENSTKTASTLVSLSKE